MKKRVGLFGPTRFGNSPNWTRTSDMRVNSSPLYQLSYRGMGCGTERIPSATPSSSRWGDLSSEVAKSPPRAGNVAVSPRWQGRRSDLAVQMAALPAAWPTWLAASASVVCRHGSPAA